MGLPRLEINSQMGLLNIRSRSAKMEGTPPGKELHITGNAGAKIGIKTTQPQIQIDQSDSFECVGVGPTLRNMKKYSARSNQKGIEQIGRIAREGLQFLRIEKGGDRAIQNIARSKGFDPPITLEVTSIPPPKIFAKMGKLEIQDQSQPIKVEPRDTPDTRKYTPGDVSVAVGVQPSIFISVVPGTELKYLDTRGSIVDTRV